MAELKLEAVRAAIVAGRDKFTAEEITPELEIAAREYMTSYVGTFDYVKDVRSKMLQGKGLSASQIKGVLNVYRADVLREIESAKAKSIQLADGMYEIGSWKFQLATQDADADFAPGETIISYPGKKKPWLGFGFVRGTKLQAWSRFRDDASSAGMLVAAELLLNSGQATKVA